MDKMQFMSTKNSFSDKEIGESIVNMKISTSFLTICALYCHAERIEESKFID